RIGWVFAAATATCLLAAATAAADRLVTVKTPDGPGPARFDRVFVHEFGPPDAGHVLVLMPGTQGGAGDFTLTARYLERRFDDLQVWAIDRRTQALEDTTVFGRAVRKRISLRHAFDYYLGWLDGSHPPKHFQFLDPSQY